MATTTVDNIAYQTELQLACTTMVNVAEWNVSKSSLAGLENVSDWNGSQNITKASTELLVDVMSVCFFVLQVSVDIFRLHSLAS